MAPPKQTQKTLVEAVQAVFDALESFDEPSRQRILNSAAALLGSQAPLAPSAPTGTHAATHKSVAVPSTDRPLSPVELIQNKAPATNAQRLAIFAYYRERVEGNPRFAKEDLRAYFSKAKQPLPANYDRDFKQAVKLGWIYEDGADSYLTSRGLEAVEVGFGGKGFKPGPKPRGKRPQSKRKR